VTQPEPEPGYCIACHAYHLLTPVPDWGGSACNSCIATRRLDPPEPGPRHVCNTSSRPARGHPRYRRCTCGQWLYSGGGYWYPVPHPPTRWLHEHGMDPGDLWDLKEDPGPRLFEDFGRRPTLLTLLRSLFRN
jgi:hypothetical protein